jgi:uncharacterized membrane protein
MKRHLHRHFSVGIFSLLLLVTAAEAQSFNFTSFDFPGATRTVADGISPGGEIVGHYTDSAGTEHGFLLSRGNFVSINYPGAVYTDARGISPSGDIVGTFKNAPGGPPNWHGYLLRHGRFTEIQVPGYLGTISQRITPTGNVYGCSHDVDFGANMRGFVRTPAGTYTVLDVPSSMNNGATPDGSVIVGLYNDMATGLSHSYLIVNGVFEPFDPPGANWSQAWDINPGADVVGQFRDETGIFHGFLMSRGLFTNIDPPGAITTAAVGINPADVVVGWYTDTNGHTHGFSAVPASE